MAFYKDEVGLDCEVLKAKTFSAEHFLEWKDKVMPLFPKDRRNGKGCRVFFGNARMRGTDASDWPTHGTNKQGKKTPHIDKKTWQRYFEKLRNENESNKECFKGLERELGVPINQMKCKELSIVIKKVRANLKKKILRIR